MVQGVNEQRFCTSCGNSVAGMRFCTNCGAPVANAAATPGPPTSPPPPPPAPPVFAQTAPEPLDPARTQPVYLPTAGQQAAPPPQPPRRRRWSDSTKAMWVLVGAALVLLVGGGALALGSISNRGGHHGVTPPRQVSDQSHSTPAGGSASSVGPGSPEGIARSLSSLMADSRMDKSEIERAASDLSSCRNIDAGVRTFDDSMRSRRRLVEEAKKVDVSALDGGRRVVDELSQAWSIAAQADRAYATWGRSVHRAHGTCVGDKAALRRATELSDRSHPHKQAAAEEWSSIARKYGLPTVKGDQL